jgi:hypothetical protein
VVATRVAWLVIMEVSGHGECIGPERERHVNVDEQAAHAISLSVQRTCSARPSCYDVYIWARKTEDYAMCSKERAGADIIKLLAFVNLKS